MHNIKVSILTEKVVQTCSVQKYTTGSVAAEKNLLRIYFLIIGFGKKKKI